MKTTILLLVGIITISLELTSFNCAAQCDAEITTIIQPDPSNGKDAYVRINDDWDGYNDNINHGYDAYLEFRFNSPSNYDRRIFIQFDSLPTDTVSQAIFKIYIYNMSASYSYTNKPIAVRKVTSAWEEGTVTAANQPTYGSTDDASTLVNIPANYGWYSWDITAMVNEWILTPSSNHGLVMFFAQTASWGAAHAYSSDYPAPSLRPKLELKGSSVTTTTCSNDSTVLNASGGPSYLWSTGDTTASIKVSPSETTVYSVTINDTTCAASVTVNIISPDITGVTSICTGDSDSTILTAPSGTGYLWNTTETTQSITVTPATDSTYYVIVTNGSCSGTTDSLSTTVTVNPNPSIPTVTWNYGGILTSSSSASYQWYRNDTLLVGATLQSYTPIESGNHKVVITDANSCAAVSSETPISVGLEEINSTPKLFIIYPNPNAGEFTLVIQDEDVKIQNTKMLVYDLLGKEVYRSSIINQSQVINLQSKLDKGVYYLRVATDKKVWSERIVLQ